MQHDEIRWKSYYEDRDKRKTSISRISHLLKKNGTIKVLDFCCGSGINGIYLARHGFDVSGFDLSPDGIRIAKKNSRRLRTHFRIWNMENKLPYNGASFDAVIIYRALYHAKLESIKRIAKEIERITRSGGLIYMESDQGPPVNYNKIGKLVAARTYLVDRGKEGMMYYHYFNKGELSKLFAKCKTKRFYFKDKRYSLLVQRA